MTAHSCFTPRIGWRVLLPHLPNHRASFRPTTIPLLVSFRPTTIPPLVSSQASPIYPHSTPSALLAQSFRPSASLSKDGCAVWKHAPPFNPPALLPALLVRSLAQVIHLIAPKNLHRYLCSPHHHPFWDMAARKPREPVQASRRSRRHAHPRFPAKSVIVNGLER